MIRLLSCCVRIALPYLNFDMFQSWSKPSGFSDSCYHLTMQLRVGYPVEHHLRERLAPRQIESRRTPLKSRRRCMRPTERRPYLIAQAFAATHDSQICASCKED